MRRFLLALTALGVSAVRESGEMPVDTGRLRNSITGEVAPGAMPGWARIGTNLEYAVYVHEGTRAHWPPAGALGGWAGRHGANPYQVAAGIGRHGTRSRRFMDAGFARLSGQLGGLASALAGDIVSAWGAFG